MSEVPARCAPFEEDLSALLDEQLDARRASEVRAHLAGCSACTRRVEALRGVDVALRRIAAMPLDAAQRERLRPALAPAAPARRGAPRRRRWIAPAALVAAAAAAATLMLVLRPQEPAAPAAIPVVVAERTVPGTSAETGLAAHPLTAPSGTPLGASAAPDDAAPRAKTPVEAAGGIASPDLLDDASDEDLALATALRDLPVLDSPRDLEVVEQLDLLETLGRLDTDGPGRG